MSSQIYRSASRTVRSLLSASKSSPLFVGRAVAGATTTVFRRNVSSLSSFYEKADSKSTSHGWIAGAMTVPAAAYMLQDQEAQCSRARTHFYCNKARWSAKMPDCGDCIAFRTQRV